MSHIPSIHDAYGGFGQKSDIPSKIELKQRKQLSSIKPSFKKQDNFKQQPSQTKILIGDHQKQKQKSNLNINPQTNQKYTQQQKSQLPTHADHAQYPTRICCPKCRNVGMTRMQSELGTAAWVWCVLLTPFAGTGFICLCLDSCRDKVHYCTRCGYLVGKKDANVC